MPFGGGSTIAARPGPPKAPKSFCAPWAAKMTPTITRTTSKETFTAERSCSSLVVGFMFHLMSKRSFGNFGQDREVHSSPRRKLLASLGGEAAVDQQAVA